MIIDNSKPYIESTSKLPKLGTVLEAIIEVQKAKEDKNTQLTARLNDISKEVTDLLNDFETSTKNSITAHTTLKGPVHGETKYTIGLGNKENLPAATAAQINAGTYPRAWLTPALLKSMITTGLGIDTSLYVESGSFPLSYGTTLGRQLFNQRLISTKPVELQSVIPTGVNEFLFSTEESYLLFGDHGQGVVNDFSAGGYQAPIGPIIIDIHNDNLSLIRNVPCSLNDITIADNVASALTGLGFGFGEYNGNFYDSNFYPTIANVSAVEDPDTSTKQSSEACLFDKTIVYKPEGNISIRNYDLTKHNFNELVFPETGQYPLDYATFLSADNFLFYTANASIEQQDGIWGLLFDVVSGDVGTPDWLPDQIDKQTNKVLSKKGIFNIIQTTVNSITGYTGSKGIIRLSKDVPFGTSDLRKNFDYSNFIGSERYGSVFIPIESLITGFNSQSAANQQLIVNRIDKELVKRITLSWLNKYTLEGLIRIPFYLEGAKQTADNPYGFNMYVDLHFKVNQLPDYNTIDLSAINYNASTKPTLDANLDLTGNLGKFKRFDTLEENPLHPKVFGGCFIETGGHIQSYVCGYRQYICHYLHDLGSVKDWIYNDITPTIKETRVIDYGTYPTNGGYGDNGRFVPLRFNTNSIDYLAYIRNKYGKFQFANVNMSLTFDPLTDGFDHANSVTWLDKTGEHELPALVINDDYTKPGVEVHGMVFTEQNGFVGSHDLQWNGITQTPSSVVSIDPVFKSKIMIESKVKDPYCIFFYYNSVLYWVISDRNGEKGINGFDTCIGGIRVDLYLSTSNTYEIRPLETMVETLRFTNLYPKPLPDGYYGRNHDSFDDVFITKNSVSANTLDVAVNFPMMMGHYFTFQIVMDGLGYYYPAPYTGITLDPAPLTGFKVNAPHNFFPSIMPPVMCGNSFHLYSSSLYAGDRYDGKGISQFKDYFMGWKDSLPLYLVGSNLTTNGQSVLVDKTVILENMASHSGKLFVTYDEGTGGIAFSKGNNTEGLTTEPTISISFVGYWEKIGDYQILSYHAPRGVTEVQQDDFINGLLPVIDNKQMGGNAMGSVFPFYLGKVRSVPRQWFFTTGESNGGGGNNS